MTYQLVIPSLENVEDLRVLQWHKAEGEPITPGELIVELETSKAVVEVRSPSACVLRKIAVGQGDWAAFGPPVAWLSDTVEEAWQPEGARDFVPDWEIT